MVSDQRKLAPIEELVEFPNPVDKRLSRLRIVALRGGESPGSIGFSSPFGKTCEITAPMP